MCTLIVGFDVLGPRTVVIAANRDENPSRPSETPRVLSDRPRIVGGRDVLSGGTWLAVRERRAAVAMLNRRESPSAVVTGGGPPRSRGLLALDVAATPWREGSTLASAARERAVEAAGASRYAPFSMAFVSPEECWVMSHHGAGPDRIDRVAPGWHVLTHADLDDPHEPRTAWLLHELRGFAPESPEDAERRLLALLADPGAAGASAHPAVCLHEGRMVTVSFSLLFLGTDRARYLHGEGRPCERTPADYSELLADERPVAERT
jgi:uncharacterized protein with NRDE domain